MYLDRMTGLIMLGAKGGGGGGGSAGGGSCKFYECASVDDGEGTPEIPAVKAGIEVSGVTYMETCNGHYALEGELQTYATALWKNSDGMKVFKCSGYDYWVLTNSGGSDPGDSYFYAPFHEGTPPWQEEWTASMGSGTMKMTGSLVDVPTVPAVPGTGVKSWTGYEWLLTTTEEGESVYALSETLTEGLSWSSVKPKIGKSYSEDVLVEAKLYEGLGYVASGAPMEGLCAWYSLHDDAADSLGKKNGTVIGDIDFSNACATNFSSSNYIKLPAAITGASTEWTFGYMLKKDENGGYDWAQAGSGKLTWYDLGEWHSLDYEYSQWSATAFTTAFDWALIVVTNSPSTGKWALYNNENSRRDSSPKSITLSPATTLGVLLDSGGNANSPTPASTRIKNAFFYNRALSAEEYQAIYQSLLEDGEFN